jgi:hypothetical protein
MLHRYYVVHSSLKTLVVGTYPTNTLGSILRTNPEGLFPRVLEDSPVSRYIVVPRFLVDWIFGAKCYRVLGI